MLHFTSRVRGTDGPQGQTSNTSKALGTKRPRRREQRGVGFPASRK